MTDQCKNCSLMNNYDECITTACHQHESWYAKQQIQTINTIKRRIKLLESSLILAAELIEELAKIDGRDSNIPKMLRDSVNTGIEL